MGLGETWGDKGMPLEDEETDGVIAIDDDVITFSYGPITVSDNAPNYEWTSVSSDEINDRLGRIEEHLAILNRNCELEGKHEELKELGRQYEELEEKLIAWELIKGED